MFYPCLFALIEIEGSNKDDEDVE
jgi:hypothetical protein